MLCAPAAPLHCPLLQQLPQPVLDAGLQLLLPLLVLCYCAPAVLLHPVLAGFASQGLLQVLV
jgi:hypothetical protein